MWYIYMCMWYILYMQSLSGGGFEGQWEQCATPDLAPISLDQLAWGLRWDLHVHPLRGNSFSPPKSVSKHTDMHISYLMFSHIHIQTHTDTYRHIQTDIYYDTDTYMQYRHDTDIYSQRPDSEPEPTGNSVYTSSSSWLGMQWPWWGLRDSWMTRNSH